MKQVNLKKLNLLKMYKTIIFLLLTVFAFQNNKAQEVYDLSRCITTSLEQNYSVKIVRNQEEIAGNNLTRGNAGYLPTVTTTNRYGGTLTTTTQNMNDGSQRVSNDVYNTTGVAGLNLNMTIFDGFNVKTTYEKLGELKKMGELNSQMSMENLVANIAAELITCSMLFHYPGKEHESMKSAICLEPHQNWSCSSL